MIPKTHMALDTHEKPRTIAHKALIVRRLICKLCRMKRGTLAIMKSIITLSTWFYCQHSLTLKGFQSTTVCSSNLGNNLAKYAF